MKDLVRPRGRVEVRRVASVRNQRGETIEPTSVRATDVKNELGRILDEVIQGHVVVITKHDLPKAVLLSVENYNALADVGETQLGALTAEYDDLLERMQTPRARAAADSLFTASPKQLGRVAARKRRATTRKRG